MAAGIFYPEEKKALADWIDRFADRHPKKEKLLGLLAPHGGYLSSGEVAGSVYSRVIWPRRVIVMGPSHTGVGRPLSLMKKGVWETPLGSLPVDEELAKRVLDETPELEADPKAHEEEHSIEVQIPFLQRLGKVDSFLPVLFQSGDAGAAVRIGQGIARAIAGFDEEVLLIATTDLTRYEPRQIAREKDPIAIERILALDEAGLFDAVEVHSISMCGTMPVAVALAASKCLGGSRAAVAAHQIDEGFGAEPASVVGFVGVTLQ